jgi:hypothetical protein
LICTNHSQPEFLSVRNAGGKYESVPLAAFLDRVVVYITAFSLKGVCVLEKAMLVAARTCLLVHYLMLVAAAVTTTVLVLAHGESARAITFFVMSFLLLAFGGVAAFLLQQYIEIVQVADEGVLVNVLDTHKIIPCGDILFATDVLRANSQFLVRGLGSRGRFFVVRRFLLLPRGEKNACLKVASFDNNIYMGRLHVT